MASAADILRIAAGEIGTQEIGSTNNVKYNTWYYGHAVSGGSYPWCAVFVSWVLSQAGMGLKIASVSGLMAHYQASGRYHPKAGYTPKAGDIFICKSRGTSHTGFVRSGGGTFTTIEGNSGNAVKSLTRHVSDASVTGFCSPDYDGSGISASGGAQTSASGVSSGSVNVPITQTKLVYNNVINNVGDPATATPSLEGLTLDHSGAHIYILGTGGKTVYEPVVVDTTEWTTSRRGQPGKLTFSVIWDNTFKVEEGNAVRFEYGGAKVFYGYIFEIQHTEDAKTKILCYDQLRYLKNKDSFYYSNRTAAEVLKLLCDDFGLHYGLIADTGYKITSRSESDKTLFDIIQNALDLTLIHTKKLYTLYDSFGSITLQETGTMLLPVLIDAKAGQSYSYTHSIDKQTYDVVKLTKDDNTTGIRSVWRAADAEKEKQWGVLQNYSTLKDGQDGVSMVNTMLTYYDRKTRNLSVTNAFGDVRVRAGSCPMVRLTLPDMAVQNFMVVDSAVHRFSAGVHTMNLTLIGGEFIA